MPQKKAQYPFRIVPRHEWGARPARARMMEQAPPSEAFLHYTDAADAARVDTQAEAYAAGRSIQAFHLDGRGWSDIGYHYLVVQLQGRGESLVLRGRDPRHVPAAQEGHNTRTLAIAVHLGPLDAVTRRSVYCIEQLIRATPTVRLIGGHGDVTPTSCPGQNLRAEIPRIARATGRAVYRAK